MDNPFRQLAKYSQEADAIYVYLNPGRVAYSKFLDDLRVIDFSEDGRVVGVEFLQVSDGIDLSDVPERDKVERLINDLGLGIKIYA
jgi:uncharacterized protein YuzE